MPAQGSGYRRSWIFRDQEVAPGAYAVRQYRDLIGAGDVVYLWSETTQRGHRTEGVVRWGFVREAPQRTPAEEDLARQASPPPEAEAEVEVEEPPEEAEGAGAVAILAGLERVSPELSRELLRGIPELRALTVLRRPAATNFRVTATEAAKLNELIRAQGGPAPPDPEGTDRGEFPPETLTDYRFSGTPTRILTTALQLLAASREERLEAPDLVTLSLELAATYTDRTGISKYLRGILGERPLEHVSGLRQLAGIEAVRNQVGPLPWLETGGFAVTGVTVAAGVLRAIDRARQLAIATTEREQVRFRHFVAALLLDDDSAIQKRIEASGFEPARLRADFLESVLATFQDDEKAWRAVLGGAAKARPQAPAKVSKAARPKQDVPPGPVQTVGVPPPDEDLGEPAEPGEPGEEAPAEDLAGAEDTEDAGAEDREGAGEQQADVELGSVEDVLAELLVPFLADRPEGRDLLGLEDEYRAFAKLIAGRETKLPMAVGLFGHWGTGKSFFMGKLRDEIGVLAGTGIPEYCHHVAQIEFNAWHYMEADIWASFADHIFRELERKTREGEDAERQREEQERFENLLDQLETWSALKESSARKLDLARERMRKARARVDHANRRASRADAVVEARREQLLRELTDGTLFERMGQVFGAAREAFGLAPLAEVEQAVDDAGNTLAEARDLLAETEGLGEQVRELASKFDPGRAARDRAVPLVGLTAAAVVLVLLLVRWNEALAGAVGTLIEVLGTTGLALGWMRERAARAATFVQELKSLRDDFEEKAEEAFTRKRSKKLARAQLKLERVASELKGAEDEHAEATSRVTDLEAEIAGSTPAERIVQFIRDRASSEAYRGRLGTLALVRRDFQRLSELLEQQARGVRMTDRSGRPIRLPELDRVVLYIDDLDRIPWEKVVQVLQAVHLLLAFPLFVVVVAVDARWVRESVEHHLRALSRDQDETLEAAPLRPGEFLEKIIQVPFWLRPLTIETTTSLIDGLIEENENGRALGGVGEAGAGDEGEDAGEPGADELLASASDGGGPGEEDGDEAPAEERGSADHDPDEDGDEERSAGAGGEEERGAGGYGSPVDDPGAEGDDRADEAGDGAGDEETDETEEPAPDRTPLCVPDIRDAEREFMKVLAPIVGRTPRVVKRFVNLYLILRAFRPETGSDGFVSADGEYRAALLLLAVLTGQAADSSNVFGWLESGAVVDTLGEWVRGESTPQVVLAAESEHVHRLLIDLVEEGHEDIRMEHVNAWLLHVSRFGFERPI